MNCMIWQLLEQADLKSCIEQDRGNCIPICASTGQAFATESTVASLTQEKKLLLDNYIDQLVWPSSCVLMVVWLLGG